MFGMIERLLLVRLFGHGTTCYSCGDVIFLLVFTQHVIYSYENCYDFLQENYSGYEFEARLNFKVHSALSLCQ